MGARTGELWAAQAVAGNRLTMRQGPLYRCGQMGNGEGHLAHVGKQSKCEGTGYKRSRVRVKGGEVIHPKLQETFANTSRVAASQGHHRRPPNHHPTHPFGTDWFRIHQYSPEDPSVLARGATPDNVEWHSEKREDVGCHRGHNSFSLSLSVRV